MRKDLYILSIDTSCDETSIAVTSGRKIYSNVIFSQIAIHKKWGGVVPMLAKRAHEKRINSVLYESLKRFSIQLKRIKPKQFQWLVDYGKYSPYNLFLHQMMKIIDYIAVTIGPGLAPSLEVGIRKAKEIAKKYDKKLITVNHMEGHVLSPLLENSRGNKSTIDDKTLMFLTEKNKIGNMLGLILSGGHTQLISISKIGSYTLLGETLDDAIGEAYDKVAKILQIGYPGGPIIEQIAKEGDENAFDFPIPMQGRKDYYFSYSGLKTAVKYLVERLKRKNALDKVTICNIAASFQKSAVASIIDRLSRAVQEYKPKGLLLGGGVASNIYVRRKIRLLLQSFNIPVYIPYQKNLCTDNAAMIGLAAYYRAKRDLFVKNIDKVERDPNKSL